jgi:hypothetical protein
VYQNGVKLADDDYTATSGTAIVLAQGASADDIVEIIAFDVFSVADTVSKADGGTFDGNVTMAGTLGVTGVLTGTSLDISGNIDVDGTTNLDVVDIDGAVDMATTLQVDGAITSSAGMTITTADNNPQLTIVSTDADGSSGAILEIQRDSASPADGDAIGQIKFTADNAAGQSTLYGTINGTLRDASDGTEDGQMQFSTMVNGSTTDFFRYGVGGDGETGVIFNEGSIDADFRVESNVNTHALFVQGSDGVVGIGTSSPNTNGVHVERSASNAMGVTVSNTEGTGSRFDLYALGSSPAIQSAHRNAIYQWTGNGIDLWSRTGDLQFGTVNALSMKIDATGAITMPLQPAFNVKPTSTQSNVAEDDTIVFGTERFDQNGDFASNTFTAPVTGKYQFTISLRVDNIDTAANWNRVELVTSNYTYLSSIIDLGGLSADPVHWHFNFSVLADLDAGDTALVKWGQNIGASQADVNDQSSFSGYLVA